MIEKSLFCFTLALIVVVSATADLKSEATLRRAFEELRLRHDRDYAVGDEEYEDRFQVYKSNLRRLEKAQRNDPGAQYKMNKFFDLTVEEFRARYLMPSMDIMNAQVRKESSAPDAISCLGGGSTVENRQAAQGLPTSFTWQGKGVLTDVKDQAACGSCWAFSTVETIESANYLAGNGLKVLSPQELVDCSHGCNNEPPYGEVCNQGCMGGWPWNAMTDLMTTLGGLELESDYPYQGVDGQCQLNKAKIAAKIANYTCISGPNTASEDTMAQTLVKGGPLSICLNAEWFQYYWGGLSDPYLCDTTSLDHCVQIVGYGQETGWLGETEEYWIIRNSWGSDWGDGGFMKLLKGANICGVANAVSFPLVKKSN